MKKLILSFCLERNGLRNTQKIYLKRAIERNLEINGEAVTRIFREEPAFPLENAKRIIGLRNQIIHGYESVSDENIWGIVINHIPNLKKDVIKLIE